MVHRAFETRKSLCGRPARPVRTTKVYIAHVIHASILQPKYVFKGVVICWYLSVLNCRFFDKFKFIVVVMYYLDINIYLDVWQNLGTLKVKTHHLQFKIEEVVDTWYYMHVIPNKRSSILYIRPTCVFTVVADEAASEDCNSVNLNEWKLSLALRNRPLNSTSNSGMIPWSLHCVKLALPTKTAACCMHGRNLFEQLG